MTVEIYADVIFFDNFVMDCLLLFITGRLLKLEQRRGGVLIGSGVGALYATAVAIYPFPSPVLQSLVTYLCISAAMSAIAFRLRKGLLLRATAGLYITAALMAGLFYLFPGAGTPSWFIENLIYRRGWRKLSFAAYLFLAFGCAFLFLFLLKRRGRDKAREGHLYQVMIYYHGKTASVTALMDTGNSLTDPLTGRPVCVIAADGCRELFRTITGVRYIPYRSVGKSGGVLPAVKAEQMEIAKDGEKKMVKEPLIAISREPLCADGRYQMLLNADYWM